MLDVAGAPKLERPLTDDITMRTGDLWHEWMYETLSRTGWPFMREVKLNLWLPEGWRGRADLVIYHPEYEAFVLGDIKTAKGESMFWLDKAGAKESHIWQASAYWHALVKMGLPMLEAAFVFYWPKEGVKGQEVEPSLQELRPIPVKTLKDEMVYRWERVQTYLKSGYWPVANAQTAHAHPDIQAGLDAWLSDELEPVQERHQKVTWNAKQEVFDLKLVPDWSAAFCEYPDELCDCNTQTTNKMGEYALDGSYSPRKGYEDVEPLVYPSERDLRLRRA